MRVSRIRLPLLADARLDRYILVYTFHVNDDDSREAGAIRADLEQQGRPIGAYDVLIAGPGALPQADPGHSHSRRVPPRRGVGLGGLGTGKKRANRNATTAGGRPDQMR